MSALISRRMEAAPLFDMELFMTLSQERRVGGDVMERLERLWERWVAQLQIKELVGQGRNHLLVWLPPEAEQEVDAAWTLSPSEGFRVNALAQSLLMAAVRDLIPQVEESGCAPAPKPSRSLAEALAAEGVPYINEGPTLERRYALVTPYPFRGGCEICAMQRECPKRHAGENGPASVLLPGHER